MPRFRLALEVELPSVDVSFSDFDEPGNQESLVVVITLLPMNYLWLPSPIECFL